MATEAVLMADQKSKLIRREEVAEGTMAFHFAKPSGFAFKAGQSADVTLIDPPDTDAEGNKRTFSIASPPFENELVFTTRMRDTAFKRSLKNVPLATEVKIGSAAGSFTLHKNPAKPAVFLAGGIGITPFLSMVRQADHDRLRCQRQIDVRFGDGADTGAQKFEPYLFVGELAKQVAQNFDRSANVAFQDDVQFLHAGGLDLLRQTFQ